MISEQQYIKFNREYSKIGKIGISALKAGISEKTGRKYLMIGKSPKELKKEHTWRTRKDPFEDVWEEVEKMLERAPELRPKTIFDYLREKYEGKYRSGQLRTLERRVKNWKMKKGKDKEVKIEQRHNPGEKLEIDWTSMNELRITINGEEYKHLLCHGVLTYSNWEWAEVCMSENFESLKKCLQNMLKHLGGVPKILQTDNSTTATHTIEKGKKAREFNHKYKSLLEHYGLTGRTTNLNSPHENGDAESLHGHLKDRIEQYLILRGSRDFSDIDSYRDFIREIIMKGNKEKTEKVREELNNMKELPEIFLPEYSEHETRVSTFSTIRVKNVVYTVPSRLKGHKVRLKIYEDKIEVLSGNEVLERLKRKRGRGYKVNYRHVIKSLCRKPGAFANCIYKEQLFPRAVFREAYEELQKRFSGLRGDKEYLEILRLASENGEEKISEILENMLKEKIPFTMDTVKRKLNIPLKIPEVNIPLPSTSLYDSFLEECRR